MSNCLIHIDDPCNPTDLGCTGVYSITDIPNFTWGDLQKVATNNAYIESLKAWKMAQAQIRSEFTSLFLQRGGKWNGNTIAQKETPILTSNANYVEFDGVKVLNQNAKNCGLKSLTITGVRLKVLGATPTELVSVYVWHFDGQEWVETVCTKSVPTNVQSFIGLDVKTFGDAVVYIGEAHTLQQFAVENGNSCGCHGKPKTKMECAKFQAATVQMDNGNYAGVSTSTANLPFSVVVSCGCDFDQFMCENKETFAPIALKALEIELLNMRLNNSRVTWFAMYGKEDARIRRDELKSEVMGMLATATNNLFNKYGSEGSCGCVECGRTRFVTSF